MEHRIALGRAILELAFITSLVIVALYFVTVAGFQVERWTAEGGE